MLNTPPPGGAPNAIHRQLPGGLGIPNLQQEYVGQQALPGGLNQTTGLYDQQSQNPTSGGPNPFGGTASVAGFGQTPVPNLGGMLTTPPPSNNFGSGVSLPNYGQAAFGQ